MPCQAIVCLFVLLGLASCVLAAVRRGRASLLAAGLSAACLAALAFMLDNRDEGYKFYLGEVKYYEA